LAYFLYLSCLLCYCFHFSGFNEKLFGNKWGGEDWEVMDRIVSKGINIIHQRSPRFYHLFHNRAGMWNN